MVQITPPNKMQNYALVQAEAGDDLLSFDMDLFKKIYKHYGALLFRGFEFSVDIFKDFTSSICTHATFNAAQGREVIDAEQAIQTVNLGQAAFPLHPEMSRVPWKPDVCFFACVSPPKEGAGGETTICDGVKLVRALPSKLVKSLKDRRLRYTEPVSPEELNFWLGTDDPTPEQLQNPPKDCPFEFIAHQGQILRSFTAPVFYKPMFSPVLCFGNFLLFARYLKKNYVFPAFEDNTIIPESVAETIKKKSDRLTHPIHWQANDVVVLDNTRFMHGRNEIIDPEGRRILTYFGYLNFAEPDKQEEGDTPCWRIPGAMSEAVRN